MKKFILICLMFALLSCVYSSSVEYKYTSSIPIEFIQLSKIDNVEQLKRILNDNNSLTILCLDKEPIKEDVLYYLGIKKYVPSKIPDYGNYTYVIKNGIIVLYPKYSVYEENGTLIFNPPKEENNSKYVFVKPYKVKIPNPSEIPDYDGYALISNSTFILYPKKYITVGKDGEFYYHPPKKENDNYTYIYTYNPPSKCIPDDYNYTFVDNNGVFIIYPKKYVVRDKDNVLIFNPPVDVKNPPIYKINYTKIADGIYEIKKNKLLFLYPTTLNDKETLDIIGEYIAKNGGVFAYINKVPPYYKHILASGVAVDKIIPDKYGDYAIDVAGRKIKVDMLDDDIINKKLSNIKALCALGINVSYIVTGSEGIEAVKKANVDEDELEEIYNYYWFKKLSDNYTHLYFNPYKENIKANDVVALSYYPLIYVDKAPETFQNDPIGNYYPKVISYKGTKDYGYWEEGPKSENKYYHLDKDEPYWEGKANEPSKWYYEGEPVSIEKESDDLWNKSEYFNHWFVKNYAYALANGCNGLFLESSDKYLVDAIFGEDNEDIDWKLDVKGKVDYIIIPGSKGFEVYNEIPVIKFPTPLKEVYGVNVVNTLYIPPKDEDFGIYIANIRDYDKNLVIKLKENETAIMSFKDLAKWLYKYNKNNIHYNGTSIKIKDNNGVKITIFDKYFNITKYDNYNFEEFDKEHYKYVIVNPPKVMNLN